MMKSKKSTASRLRHRLTLQGEVQTPDGAGGYAKTWQNVADLWAEIIPVGGNQAQAGKMGGKKILFAGQMQPEISHRILLRYNNSVTAAMRLVFENRVFNIHYVANVEEKRDVLELLVWEGIAT